MVNALNNLSFVYWELGKKKESTKIFERMVEVRPGKALAHANLGTALKIIATPSYVIHGVAVLGHPGLAPLRQMVRSVRACKAPVC